MILLLSLFSPLTELLPNLYMSWWMPSNRNLADYHRFWYRRIAVVLVVWVPILVVLSSLTSVPVLIVIASVIFGAFGWRMVRLRRFLEAKLSGADIDLGSEVAERLYFLALVAIMGIIYANLPSHRWVVFVGAAGIFGGALTIGRFRDGAHRSMPLDVAGRIIFSGGFLVNLHNLARAAEVI